MGELRSRGREGCDRDVMYERIIIKVMTITPSQC